MNNIKGLNRRDFLGNSAAFVAGSSVLNSALFAMGKVNSRVQTKPLYVNGRIDYSAIRGFNYMPSYSSRLQYTWTNFDRKAWEREVPYALRFGSNTLRIWLNWGAYLAIGPKMFDNLDTALAIMDKHNIKAMPVLFNRWNDPIYPAGGIFQKNLNAGAHLKYKQFFPYVDEMMERFCKDKRVAIWDLCNEPDSISKEEPPNEYDWLVAINDRVRKKTSIPVTIGTMTNVYLRPYASMVDVISFHPYPRKIGEMEEMCKSHLAIAKKYSKPLICTETCCGALDDKERGDLARDNIETLEKYKIGWLAWQLVSGRFTTGSRERTDNNAVRPGEGYMPWIMPDGSTRPYHEWLEVSNP